MMDFVENLYRTVAGEVCGGTKVVYKDVELDFSKWERLTMTEAVKKYSGVDFAAVSSDEEARAVAKEKCVELE